MLKQLDTIVWGPPLLILLVGTGIILTVELRALQLRKFPLIMKSTLFKIFDKTKAREGTITPFQSVATALAATIGTGNIVGVATAIIIGGPGAIFWMWLAAFFGMATKYAEVTLSVAYREKNSKGELVGGPMYYIQNGLGLSRLARLFAIFAVLATFGIGSTTQANAISGTLKGAFGFNTAGVGLLLSITVAVIIVGGLKSIAKVTEKLVPFMAGCYLIGGLIVLIINYQAVPGAIASIFTNAFNPRAAVGGTGVGLVVAMQAGVSRGLFTNEAGLGSSPIAQASADTDHPSRQGLWGIFEVFMDSIVVCTVTALVILSSGVLSSGVDATSLSAAAFSNSISYGGYIVTFGLVLFAFSTILGWEYYGETSARYLLGDRASKPYRIIFTITVFLGAVMELEIVWYIANILNGLMAIPNLIGVLGLSSVVVKLTKDFLRDPDKIRDSEDQSYKKHLL
ncbi:MAG: sodium:alanine symporter family protein [Clostridiales bacterium]|nr:sodium:alanine symporter family protein [Clostridiales bacterium]